MTPTTLSYLAVAAGAGLAVFGVVCLNVARRDERRAARQRRIAERHEQAAINKQRLASEDKRAAIAAQSEANAAMRLAQQRMIDAARLAHPSSSPYPEDWT